jgi:hypothetical protein
VAELVGPLIVGVGKDEGCFARDSAQGASPGSVERGHRWLGGKRGRGKNSHEARVGSYIPVVRLANIGYRG